MLLDPEAFRRLADPQGHARGGPAREFPLGAHRPDRRPDPAVHGPGEGDQAREDAMKGELLAALRRTFRPEFLNRVDEVIVFHSLARDQLEQIVEKMLRDLRHRLADRSMSLELTEAARDWVVDNGFEREYGARPLRRLIQREIENALARKVLAREYQEGDLIVVDVQDGRPVFRRQPGTNQVKVPEEIAV